MGSYLSSPITEKVSSDDSNKALICGASSMQGCRKTQEDAHNCILDYDTNSSYFAVYDGHGGQEVALYCSENLPQFLKQSEAYKKGDMKKALEDAFLEFDDTITTPEVIEKLKLLAQDRPEAEDRPSDDDSEDDADIENCTSKLLLHSASESVKSMLTNNLQEPASESSTDKNSSDVLDNVSSSNSTKNEAHNLTTEKSDSIKNADLLSTTKNCDISEIQTESLIPEIKVESPDSSVSKSKIATDSRNNNNKLNAPLNQHTEVISAQPDNTNTCDNVTNSVPQENGDILKTDKTKTEKEIKSNRFSKPKITAQELYNRFLELDSSDEENSDDEEEMDAISPKESSDEDEEDVGEENSEDSSEEDNKKDYAYDHDIVREFFMNMRDEPGSNSGCTAVVALLHENELYVANAGDSRCIVCRNGKAIEMSFDHKPQNKEEYKRIRKAGGRVTLGRVNDGLNLSRAIGDHVYKQNKDLSNREQMITALPDIRTLTIHPNEDEFMVLACDGIWNCRSNQEVVDFIRPAIQEGKKKLSVICEEMFDDCLSSSDDNMTAIIVQFKSHILKRSAEESECNKRLKTEENRDTDII